MAVMVGRW